MKPKNYKFIDNSKTMKQLLPFSHWKWLTTMITLIIGLFVASNTSRAQLPDCISGTVMYGVFSNASSTSDSLEIRPINYTTGAIGNLMGVRRYWIRRRLNSSSSYIYGSAAMGVDVITNRFYIMTQMSGSQPKDIISIDPMAPTATGTVIATTSGMDSYHFVKLAISPNGYGYAIGVQRDSNSTASTFNPLIRFSTCGASPSAGCANASVITLGYLPATGNTYKWKIYNGDIAFDNGGNLYFLSAAYENIGGMGKYTDARLYRINSTDIPAVAGVGTIPMTFIADFNIIDSTGVSGIALDAAGSMYLSVKRFTSNNDPGGAFNSELYKSAIPGSANQIGGFAPIPVNKSIGDLASCYFPATILASNKLLLSGTYAAGNGNLRWEINSDDVVYFEVQRSDDGSNFETIATIPAIAGNTIYTYKDIINGGAKNKFYRIREVMNSSTWRFYSNVVNLNISSKFSFVAGPNPNPFINDFNFKIQLKSAGIIQLKLSDQNGRMVHQRMFKGQAGLNNLYADGLSGLSPGIYMAEFSVEDEVLREKIMKK